MLPFHQPCSRAVPGQASLEDEWTMCSAWERLRRRHFSPQGAVLGFLPARAQPQGALRRKGCAPKVKFTVQQHSWVRQPEPRALEGPGGSGSLQTGKEVTWWLWGQ